MTKKMLFLLFTASMFIVFGSTAIFAGADYPEKVTFDTPGIDKDKYEAVTFNHKAHAELGYTCAECHHDDKGKSIEGLKMGDSVQKCIECHSNIGMGKEDKKAKDSYYAAFHDKGTESCKGCHKDYNTEKGLKKTDKGYAPNGCTDCHDKKKG